MNLEHLILFIGALALGYYGFTSDESRPEFQMLELWTTWKNLYGREYISPNEERIKMSVFLSNYERIKQWNMEGNSVVLGLNKFADLTPEEFRVVYASCTGSAVVDTNDHAHGEYCTGAENCIELEPTNQKSVDWVKAGAVTPVKSQEQCGSCWAFSAVGALEGLYFLNHSKLISFSEQQVVDCDSECFGCFGGWTYSAFKYAANSGLLPEQNYPYRGYQDQCQYKRELSLQINKGYRCIKPKSLEQLKAAVAMQPVSVSVEADEQVWQFYSSGVIDKNCGTTLNHAVLVVGYGPVNGTDAWMVKNSWGQDWGQNGFVYLSMDEKINHGNGICGILKCGFIPTN